ncbi:rod shape-determining protein RodA [Coralloluteibacterium thermophilus]|uniref:Peptidoglycan glycosyltransferase MrdB n=1 Tax=Coralloluteibacterium thermophilum TaxID=2707049 RepID=A0ABV9NRQ4_9GAMM
MNALLHWSGDLFRRAFGNIDLPLGATLVALLAIGLVVLHSAGGDSVALVVPQALRFGVGLAALVVISRIPPGRLRLWTPYLFAGSLLLLMLVPVLGTGRSGRHWLNLGVFYLQPAELMKLTVPMMVAWILHRQVLPPRFPALVACAAVIGVPTALIVAQPDLGTGLLIGLSGAFAVFLAGLSWWYIGAAALAAAVAAPLAWLFGLQEYQKNRILTFLDAEADPLGTGWNILQSKIAVGSGGLTGKGWGQGTQSHLNFLPEHTTDFIFAVLSEEFGWVGVCVTLALYLFVLARCLWIAAEARESYGRLVAGALALTFSVYVLVNGGMVAGLLPVVGVPMPLLSYGGTSAVSLLAGFGIVMSVAAHKRFIGA